MSYRTDAPTATRFALLALLLIAGVLRASMAASAVSALPYVTAVRASAAGDAVYDGVVEAVTQTVIGAQVAGTVTAVNVKAGDAVLAGQLLVRIDSRAAEQSAAAAAAQVRAARAALELAARDVDRQRQLYRQRYISEAALDRAEAQFKATEAQVSADLAQSNTAQAQSGYFSVHAPYTGIVAEVPVTVGDMAVPGRALIVLYEPSLLRVAVAVPQSAVPGSLSAQSVRIEIPGGAGAVKKLQPTRVVVLPTADPGSHTVTVRLELPARADVKPGTFARTVLPAPAGASDTRIFLPVDAIVRHAEMTGVYVLDADHRPLLRAVRIGRTGGDRVEVLAGVSPGDRVVTDTAAAARLSVRGK